MKEYSIFFAKSDYYNVIKVVGGKWNDSKERPLVCLLKIDDSDIYWAIPIGNWYHRNKAGQQRIMSFINSNPHGIQSCFYHVGKTTTKSIFFISDAVPITDKYFDRSYLGYNNQPYSIRNTKLQNALIIKLKRILRQEKLHPNYFRQHITDIKAYLINELNQENTNAPYKMPDSKAAFSESKLNNNTELI